MTLSIEDMLKSKENTTAPRFQWREAGAEGMSPVESVTNILKGPGACLVNANAAEDEKHCICPERGHGRLSSSSARHRRRVVDPADPPSAVNVASPTTAASSASTHASSSSSSAHAPDGPVALLASVVIRKLRVDHRLETECTSGRAWCVRGAGLGSVERVEILSDLPWGEERGAFWGGVAVGLVAYRGTHNATMRFTTLQNISVSMLGRIRVRRFTTEPVEGVREGESGEGESRIGCWARRLIRGGAGGMGSGRTRGARVMRGAWWTRGCVPPLM